MRNASSSRSFKALHCDGMSTQGGASPWPFLFAHFQCSTLERSYASPLHLPLGTPVAAALAAARLALRRPIARGVAPRRWVIVPEKKIGRIS